MQSTKFYIHETHGLVFTDEEIVLISKEIQEKNIQKAINLIGTKTDSIKVIKEIIDLLKVESAQNHIKSSENDNLNEHIEKSNDVIAETKSKNWFDKLKVIFQRPQLVSDTVKPIQDTKIDYLTKSQEETLENLILQFREKILTNLNFSSISVTTNPNGLNLYFKGKQYWLCFKKISNAYLPYNKDASRIQFSGKVDYSTRGNLIPIGVDIENRVFVFWNPVGFLKRVINNKNSSFYSSFNLQKRVASSGYETMELANETIFLSNLENLDKVFDEIFTNSESIENGIYTVNRIYIDKLTVLDNEDQISRWLSTDSEIYNRKNPFNNYRGIRTLEFNNPKKLIVPAFFVFTSTKLKRKDKTANIWKDSLIEESGELTYHGDGKPGREFINPQNHGNCRLWKLRSQINVDSIFCPPVIYFQRIAKGQLKFKGIFKIRSIEEQNDEFEGSNYKNVIVHLFRDNDINRINVSEIISIRENGISKISKFDWYFRNCSFSLE
jgi:hypothetical protein